MSTLPTPSKPRRTLADIPRKLIDLATGAEWRKWSRVVMNAEMAKLVDALHPKPHTVLEISGGHWASYGFADYRSTSFPEFDVCKDRIDGVSFDLIVADQVWEHLLYPHRAATNVWKMLRPGGHFLLSTPFLVRIHDVPDCTRWTETGLRYMLAEAGFPLEMTKTGSWGNRDIVRSNLRSMKWTRYRRYLHSLHNEPLYPYSVWAIAQRPSHRD